MIAGNISDQTTARKNNEAGKGQLNEAAPKRVPAQYAAGPPRPRNRAAISNLPLNHERLWWIVIASPSQITRSQKGIGKPGLLKVKKTTCCSVPSTSKPRNIRNPIIFRSSPLHSEVAKSMSMSKHPTTAPGFGHLVDLTLIPM